MKRFTGIDSDYEAPENADLILKAGEWSEGECVLRLLEFLHEKLIIPVEAIKSLDKLDVRELMVYGDGVKAALIREASEIPKIEITEIDKQWLQVLAEGWATPLTGFMRERQYLQCLHHGQIFDLKKKCTEPGSSVETATSDGVISSPVNQSIPIVLPITNGQRKLLLTGNDNELCKAVGLTYKGKLLAVLRDPEVFPHRKEERVARQFGFTDCRHPTIDMIMKSGEWLLGGDVEVVERITYDDGLDNYRLTPMELRQRFKDENCDAVFVFQLRNPIHNGHALLMRDTRKQLLKKFKNPMLLLHPLGGWTKDDDVPLNVRIEQHKAVLSEGILDPKWTVLAIFPSPMLYAGPTEVQWHARARIAAGVTTYIVGRDPAGIAHPDTGDYLYDPSHGSKVLTMAPGLSALEIIPFRVAAYDKMKGEMDFFDSKRKDDFLFISGTKMRQYARDGVQPPDGFMAPKAWEVLASYYKAKNADHK